jgi:protein PhnA
MSHLPPCPACKSPYSYEDQEFLICPECAHQWAPGKHNIDDSDQASQIRDSNGNVLADGDYVTVIKDLKIKGTSSVVKVGTKVKILRLVDGDHDIDCRIDGIGPMMLKSAFVKKV